MNRLVRAFELDGTFEFDAESVAKRRPVADVAFSDRKTALGLISQLSEVGIPAFEVLKNRRPGVMVPGTHFDRVTEQAIIQVERAVPKATRKLDFF